MYGYSNHIGSQPDRQVEERAMMRGREEKEKGVQQRDAVNNTNRQTGRHTASSSFVRGAGVRASERRERVDRCYKTGKRKQGTETQSQSGYFFFCLSVNNAPVWVWVDAR